MANKKDMKQRMASGLGSLLQPTTPKAEPQPTAEPTATTPAEPQNNEQPQVVAAGVRKSRSGRKATIKEHTDKVRAGLNDGYTRATVIVKAEYIDKLKQIAYNDRTTIKDTLDVILGDFLTEYERQNGKIEL